MQSTAKDLPEQEENVAGTSTENRNFVSIELGGEKYRALFDPGAMLSLVGPKIANLFQDRLEPSNLAIKNVTGGITQVLGILKIILEIDGAAQVLETKAVSALDHDVILGMDFCRDWDIESKLGRGLWRAKEGKWRKFVTGDDEGGKIHAECAGISELRRDQRKLIDELVDRVLPPPSENPGCTGLIEHFIDVQGAAPIKHRPRRMSPKMLEIAREEVEKMLRQDIIERSYSAWSSAPVIVKKHDGGYRFCVDFRDVNKVTKKDAYPTQNMDSILDKLRKARYLTKIDLKQAYFQIKMERSSRQYTAFSVPGSGLWQFKRMAFGLSNSPMTFLRLVDALFGPEFEPNVFAYLDDILIVTEKFEEHLKWLEFVLRRLVDAGLVVNREKCEFCCSRVSYLGFLLDKEGLRPDPERIEPVLNFPAPQSVKQLRRFLGMVGWYSRFIDRDADIKIPLVKLLRKEQEWSWGVEQQEAFDQFKKALTSAPVLARPDFGRVFSVQCDASNFAIGAVLTQEGDDGEHPVVYISRVLNSAEKNYTTTEKECLAVVWAIKKLRPYLEGYSFKVITDHSALKWLRNLKEPTGRLARWALEMQQWDFEIEHRKGAMHHVPDALSRGFETAEEEVAAFEMIRDRWYLERVEDVKKFPKKFASWKVEDEMLYRYKREELLDPVTNDEEGWKLVVPEEYRERILRDAHREPSSGHLGIEKTYDRIAREYYWPGAWYDVQNFVRECPECQQYKVPQTGPQGLMGKRIVERPWAVVAADTMEFPQSKGQYKYLLVFQDLFTRWIELKPLRTADGKAVSRAFEELVLFRWETPDYLLTDNGKEFDNKVVKQTLEEYGVKHVTTPPYHPQANPVERSNRTLKTMIATLVGTDQRNWDQHLHAFRHAVNTAMQATTKVSPAFLNYGRNPRPVKSLRREVESRGPKLRIDPEVWKNRVKKLDYLRDLVAKHIDRARSKQEGRYNRGRKDVSFHVGDEVMRRVHVLSNAAQRFSAKLAPKFDGPYRVVEIKSPTVYVLDLGPSRKNAKVHVSELKRFVPPRRPVAN